MDEELTPREQLQQRLGLSKAELARMAGIDPGTVAKILKGHGGHVSKERAVDEAMARVAAERGLEVDHEFHLGEPRRVGALEDGLIEFEVGGNFGVSVVVRGPVADREALENSVLRLIQGMNQTADGSS